MTYWQAWMACGLLMSLPAAAQADIFRWDNGQVIPGTQGITPGPATQLGARVLQFAELSNTDLSGSSFYDYMLHGSDLRSARFTNANLSFTVLTLSNLSGADFAGATVIGTYLWATGFTKEQLYSTASYQAKDLHEIQIGTNNLAGWDFSGQDLSGAAFSQSTLTNTNLAGAYLRNAYFDGATLTNADLSGTNLTNAVLAEAALTNANLAGAVVAGATFESGVGYWGGPGGGITVSQLYSTASYQQRNLRGIGLSGNDLTGGDFSGQDLSDAELGGATVTNANFSGATLTNADLSGTNLTDADLAGATLADANFAGAVVTGADFGVFVGMYGHVGSGITLRQLYSTASYQQRNLRGIGLRGSDLTGGDFSGQDLTGADFGSALTSANFAGAVIAGARFFANASDGFTKEQLYSTASYQQKNLRGIQLGGDLTSWDFNGQDLAGASFSSSTLTSANFAGAMVTGANFGPSYSYFGDASRGFTKEQLYSTASYQQRNLNRINLSENILSGWDFSGQDLTGANFSSSALVNADLSGTNLTDAELVLTSLTNANLAGAMVAGANFHRSGFYGGSGITLPQLYSTASYQQRNLRGIGLSGNNLSGGDFSGQDLTGADLMDTNFSFADLRGALVPSGLIRGRNTIGPLGAMTALDLQAGDTLVVRDSDIGITVNYNVNALSGGTLELVLGDADWGSTMVVATVLTPHLGGTLRVRFADQADLSSMLGTTFDLFDWPTVLQPKNRFDAIELPPGTQWDFSQLYVTGTAQLTAIPEPSAIFLLASGTAAWILGWAFRQRRQAGM